MSKKKTFKAGDQVYSLGGQCGRYVGAATNGHAVEPMYDHDDDGTSYYGVVQPWHEVFAEPPKEWLHEQIAELNRLIEEKRNLLAELREQSVAENSAVRERAARLKQHYKLKHLDDFIAGRITHFVIVSDYEVTIETFKQTLEHPDRREPDLRLLSLYGRSNGDISWKVNMYYDGSGSNRTVIPCMSEADAHSEAQREMDRWCADIASSNKPYCASAAVRCARKHGLSIPNSIVEIGRRYEIEAAQKNAANAKKTYDEYLEKLGAAQRIA